MSKVPITPLGARVVAVNEKPETKTAAGLYLPDNAREKSQVARVVAVGSDVKDLRDSDRIVFKEYATTDLKIDGENYLILKEEDVLAKVA